MNEGNLLKAEHEREVYLKSQLKRARKMVEEKVTAIKRDVSALGRWQRRVSYYERETQIPLAMKRAQRRPRRVRRKIAL